MIIVHMKSILMCSTKLNWLRSLCLLVGTEGEVEGIINSLDFVKKCASLLKN
jgi:hypothetical protein